MTELPEIELAEPAPPFPPVVDVPATPTAPIPHPQPEPYADADCACTHQLNHWLHTPTTKPAHQVPLFPHPHPQLIQEEFKLLHHPHHPVQVSEENTEFVQLLQGEEAVAPPAHQAPTVTVLAPTDNEILVLYTNHPAPAPPPAPLPQPQPHQITRVFAVVDIAQKL